MSPGSLTDALSDTTVFVTGGTGSFGTTVPRKFLTGVFVEVRILGRDRATQDQIRDVPAQRAAPEIRYQPAEYRIVGLFRRAVNLIHSTMHAHHAWDGVRRCSAERGGERDNGRIAGGKQE